MSLVPCSKWSTTRRTGLLPTSSTGTVAKVTSHEVVPFIKPVKAVGNIEDRLMSLLKNMQATLKGSGSPVRRRHHRGPDRFILSRLRRLVDGKIAQFALLDMQIMWTYERPRPLSSSAERRRMP